VDTFEPETTKPLSVAIADLAAAEKDSNTAQTALRSILAAAGVQGR